jgi:hypothetical protein
MEKCYLIGQKDERILKNKLSYNKIKKDSRSENGSAEDTNLSALDRFPWQSKIV